MKKQEKPPTDTREMISLSKYLSFLLRHHPEQAGIRLDEHGWADVNELIKGVNKTHPITKDLLEQIVREDSKQRYAFNDDHTKIRASQGHSIAVEVQPQKKNPPEILWHGSARRNIPSILKEGLNPMGRLYVHLSKDPQTARQTGARHGSPVVFEIDAGKMAEDGFDFFISENGVWQTKTVPPRYLKISEY